MKPFSNKIFITIAYIILSNPFSSYALPDCEDCVASCDGNLACISSCEEYCDGVPINKDIWVLSLAGGLFAFYTFRKSTYGK